MKKTKMTILTSLALLPSKIFILFTVCLFFLPTAFAQTQLGTDIIGEAIADAFGVSVSLSGDGNRLAVGAKNNSGGGSFAGHVRVYSWSGASWTQLGADIDGEAAEEFSGISVSLSLDGNHVAIGSINKVRVYSWNGSAWAKKRPDIDVPPNALGSGLSVSISSDGNRLAIGDPVTGQLHIYAWSGSAWTQLGNSLVGHVANSNVAISGDGNTVAVSTPIHNARSGRVQIYFWNGTSWVKRGANIDGGIGEELGRSVSLSSDGSRVVIGATGYDNLRGAGRVYAWNGSAWGQLGSDLVGEAERDLFGYSTSISDDGNHVAIGSSENSSYAGHVRVYSWDGSSWMQVGSDIDGKKALDLFGYSVALNADGTRLAVGALQDGNIIDPGYTSVYETGIIPGPTCTIPNGFTSTDIGDVSGNAGKACRDASGVYKVVSAGTGIKGAADGFHYVYKSQSGDVDMMVRVPTIPNNSVRRAGLMIRTGTGPDAANVSLLINGKKEVKLYKRATNGGATITIATKFAKKRQGTYLRLSYSSATNSILAYHSNTGASTSWKLVGMTSMTLSGNYLAGLATTRGQSGNMVQFKLDKFKVNGTAFRLADAGLDFQATVFPNPFENQLGYRLEGLLTEATVRLLDLQGRQVAVATLDPNVATGGEEGVFNTSHLAPGMYFLEVIAHGERKLVKVVKR